MSDSICGAIFVDRTAIEFPNKCDSYVYMHFYKCICLSNLIYNTWSVIFLFRHASSLNRWEVCDLCHDFEKAHLNHTKTGFRTWTCVMKVWKPVLVRLKGTFSKPRHWPRIYVKEKHIWAYHYAHKKTTFMYKCLYNSKLKKMITRWLLI